MYKKDQVVREPGSSTIKLNSNSKKKGGGVVEKFIKVIGSSKYIEIVKS